MDQGTDPVTGRTADARIDTTRMSNNPQEIADDIRETRAEMDGTIDALSAKLDPSHLIDQAKDAFTSSARDAGSSMMDQLKDSSILDTIKENPIPAAAVGLSVAWLLSKMGESESDKYRHERYRATGDPYYAPRRPRYAVGYQDEPFAARGYYDGDSYRSQPPGVYRGDNSNHDPSLADKASDAFDTAKGKASSALDSARDSVSDAVDSVQDSASGAADGVRGSLTSSADASRQQAHQFGNQVDRAQRQASSWLDRQMHDNPLAVGAVALAAGALVGMSVPETNAEHQAFGAQADHVKNRLAQEAESHAQDVKSAAKDVADEAKAKAEHVADEASDKGQAVADDAAGRAKSVAGEAEDAAKKAADQAGSSGTYATTPATGASPSGVATSPTNPSSPTVKPGVTASSPTKPSPSGGTPTGPSTSS